MVDPDRVRRLLGALSDYRDRLAELRELATERYVQEQALAGLDDLDAFASSVARLVEAEQDAG